MPEELQEIKRKFTIKIPNAYFDPMIKRGLKPDSEVFYVIDPSDASSIIIPSGLLAFVTDVPETPEYSEQEILEHIENLNMPFKLYDYQKQIVVESIQKKNQIALAATGCLDPQSEINVEISEDAYKLLKKFLTPKGKIKTTITYEELLYLKNNNQKIKVETPNGYDNISRVFEKYFSGRKLYLSDDTCIKCADTHYLLVNNEWLPANELNIGDFLTDKFGKKSKQIIGIEIVPSQRWIDFEVQNEFQTYIQNGVIHHNSGKSACIYCILSFFKSKNLKGMLLVPSVSLTTQIYNDCKDYNASDDFLESIRLIGGDNKVKAFDKQITVTTWQSAMLIEKGFENFDFVIIDETHQLKLDTKAADIVYKCTNAKYRIGLTGTLPEDQIAKMSIMACTGKPKRYIKTQGLIERGLATPVNINVIRLMYNNDDKAIFKHVGNYTKQLQFIKEHKNRNILISRLSDKVTQNGNTVVLCQHIQHMQDLFTLLINIKNPGIKVEKKHIVGKHAVEFQEEYKVFYVAGATKPKDREKIFDILRTHNNCIVVSGYALMSTGLNIKSLKNIVFASPLKSYTTITQSLGRAIRLFVSKNTAEIYDFVDDLSARGRSGPFYRQYINRLNLSYIPEGFPIQERLVIV